MQNDVTYLAIILGLFALMFLLVKACDLIIGSDEEALEDRGGGDPIGADQDAFDRNADDRPVAA